MTILICLVLFLSGYLLNIFYITVLYHRGLTHSSLILRPQMTRFLALTGNWVTGIDPKAWACMHRLHHIHSDTELDPHSPSHQGVMGIWLGQLKSYNTVLRKLIKKDKTYTQLVSDIPFEVSFLNKNNLWYLPYLLHVALAVAIGTLFSSYFAGIAYYLGIMSHPIQGWMVNALAHKYGYRNFDSSDNSKNNKLIAFLVFGEGYQNNHHHFPNRANFAVTENERDLGHSLCLLAQKAGLLEVRKA